MVRRRNRFILVVDGGCDLKFEYEDLGNAVRKISIDLGVSITFTELDKLCTRPEKPTAGMSYIAVGKIHYSKADGPSAADGVILYVKPAYHGIIEGAGVRNYAMANMAFPHESTGDQWFSESQFESYRSLGLEIAGTFMNHDMKIIPPDNSQSSALTLAEFLKTLPETARP
jgi:hypothetical protein